MASRPPAAPLLLPRVPRGQHAVRPGQTEELRGETWGEVASGDVQDDAEGWEDELREVAPFLVRAGWNVMLDGVRFELKETPQ